MQEASIFSPQEPSNQKLGDSRPAKLDLTSIASDFKRWAECKIIGKNITVRSYAGACAHNSELFVYGGLQILNGILSDFNSINLGQQEGRFQWRQIKIEGDNPGPRARCGMVCTKEGMIYLIGGIKSTSLISNQIHCYNIQKRIWRRENYTGELPPLQSFGVSFLDNERIILVCGYDGTLNTETNGVYEYNIGKNEVRTLFKHIGSQPPPRSNCAVTSDGKGNIYMFGGRRGDLRMNDLWMFNLETNRWSPIKPLAQLPSIRSGHIMQYVHGSLLVYGGLHEVTWELDDLLLYDIQNNAWKILEIDSARKIKQPVHEQQSPDDHRHNHVARKQVSSPNRKRDQKYFVDTVTSMKPKEIQFMETRKEGSSPQNPEKDVGGHPGSMLNEKRKKQFLQRKADMLKIFEVPQETKGKYLNVEPIAQAINNSLEIVGDPNSHPKQHHNTTHSKLTSFGKNYVSKFLEPLSNTVNVAYGKKPCARDGHNAAWIGGYLVIFGGDRHHMSFNDIYRLDTQGIHKEFN